MTVLSTWVELSKLYNASRPKMLHPLFLNGGLRQTWPVWAVISAGIALMLSHSLQPDSLSRALATASGVALFALGLLLAKERALAWNFRGHYQRHAIGKLSFFKRENYLRYALFVEALQSQGKTSVEVKKLLKAAQIAGDPEKPNLASQSVIIIALLGALVAVSANLLLHTAIWKTNGALFLLPILLGLFVAWMVVNIARDTRHREQLIVCFLERAKLEIELNETHTAKYVPRTEAEEFYPAENEENLKIDEPA